MPGMTSKPIFIAPGDGEAPVDDMRPVLVVAGMGRRVAGRVLDLGITVLGLATTGALAGAVARVAEPGDELFVTLFTMVMVGGMIASVALPRIVALALLGWTVGQRLTGTRVVDAASGEPVRGWRAAFRRCFVPRPRNSFLLLDDLTAMSEDRWLRRCEHDRRAGTVVVRTGRDRRSGRA